VTHENDAALLGDNLSNRRQGGSNAKVVGNDAVRRQGHVEVDADENLLAVDRPNVVNGVLGFERVAHNDANNVTGDWEGLVDARTADVSKNWVNKVMQSNEWKIVVAATASSTT
jgi:hypothetical protein